MPRASFQESINPRDHFAVQARQVEEKREKCWKLLLGLVKNVDAIHFGHLTSSLFENRKRSGIRQGV